MASVMAKNDERAASPDTPVASAESITESYVQMTRLIERLHRRHLDMLRFELDRLEIEGISAAQALMLTKIQGQTIGVRDLIERGYYLGSNASYNIKQMVECGLIEQERSPHDRRAMRVRLTERGEDLCRQIAMAEHAHGTTLIDELGGLDDIDNACSVLKSLENTWSNYLRYGDH